MHYIVQLTPGLGADLVVLPLLHVAKPWLLVFQDLIDIDRAIALAISEAFPCLFEIKFVLLLALVALPHNDRAVWSPNFAAKLGETFHFSRTCSHRRCRNDQVVFSFCDAFLWVLMVFHSHVHQTCFQSLVIHFCRDQSRAFVDVLIEDTCHWIPARLALLGILR